MAPSARAWPLTALAVAALALAALAVGSGCDDDQTGPATTGAAPAPPPARPLPEAQQGRAFSAQQRVTAYCRELTESIATRTPPPPPAARRRALAASARLTELARARPYDLVQTGVDVRLFVGDLIEDLGNLDCDPQVVETLEAGVG